MMRSLAALAILLGASSIARAQESTLTFALPEFKTPDPFQSGYKPESLLGFRAGFVMATDADEAVPFVGFGARFHFSEMGAVEISMDYWVDEFADGDLKVTHYPVMASIMAFFPIEIPTTSPYVFAGVGLHGASFDYSGVFAGERDETDAEFSFHGGAGLEMTMGSALKIHMDVRWILLDPDPIAALRDEDFDTVQFTFAVDFRF